MSNIPPTKSLAPDTAPAMTSAAPDPSLTPPAQPPAIPLTTANRKLYQDLYDKMQFAISNTKDGIALETLNDSRAEVRAVLDNNDTYNLTHNTGLFTELLGQIKETNKNLTTLETQIDAVASHIATAADIIAAIDKVTTAIPTFV